MEWMAVLCYTLFAYGVSNMVVYARGPFAVFERWRGMAARISGGLGEMFSCMICFPTWVGIVSSVMDIMFTGFSFTPFNILFGDSAPWWFLVGMDACYTSGTVWLIDQLETAFERHGAEYTDETDGDDE